MGKKMRVGEKYCSDKIRIKNFKLKKWIKKDELLKKNCRWKILGKEVKKNTSRKNFGAKIGMKNSK